MNGILKTFWILSSIHKQYLFTPLINSKAQTSFLMNFLDWGYEGLVIPLPLFLKVINFHHLVPCYLKLISGEFWQYIGSWNYINISIINQIWINIALKHMNTLLFVWNIYFTALVVSHRYNRNRYPCITFGIVCPLKRTMYLKLISVLLFSKCGLERLTCLTWIR